MRRFFNRFRPRVQTHLFLRCNLGVTGKREPANDVAPASVHWIRGSDDARFSALRAFAAAQGFGEEWPDDMLRDRAQCALAMDDGDAPMAMGWMTRQAFDVEEIGARFDPGEAVYLFGDWVAPAFRGRRLQRLLVSHRLGRAQEVGVGEAYTIIHPDNAASIRSYGQEGFVEEGRVETKTWLGRKLTTYESTVTPARLSYANGTVSVLQGSVRMVPRST